MAILRLENIKKESYLKKDLKVNQCSVFQSFSEQL